VEILRLGAVPPEFSLFQELIALICKILVNGPVTSN
jgi:hypothetical protein